MARQRLDINSLLTKIVHLLLHHSPSELSFSKVARLTKVPRSTLYYYFGNVFNTLIEEAARFSMKHFVNLEQLQQAQPEKTWHEFQTKRLKLITKQTSRYPWGPQVYFKYRNHQGPLGIIIREVEDKYIKQFIQTLSLYDIPKPSENQIKIISSIKLGFLWGIGGMIEQGDLKLELFEDYNNPEFDMLIQGLLKAVDHIVHNAEQLATDNKGQ